MSPATTRWLGIAILSTIVGVMGCHSRERQVTRLGRESTVQDPPQRFPPRLPEVVHVGGDSVALDAGMTLAQVIRLLGTAEIHDTGEQSEYVRFICYSTKSTAGRMSAIHFLAGPLSEPADEVVGFKWSGIPSAIGGCRQVAADRLVRLDVGLALGESSEVVTRLLGTPTLREGDDLIFEELPSPASPARGQYAHLRVHQPGGRVDEVEAWRGPDF